MRHTIGMNLKTEALNVTLTAVWQFGLGVLFLLGGELELPEEIHLLLKKWLGSMLCHFQLRIALKEASAEDESHRWK